MADNFLEKRMDEHRNGGTGVVIRKHKMPKRKRVLLLGCQYKAHLDLIRSLCNGGHQIELYGADAALNEDVRRTLARVVDCIEESYDVVVLCENWNLDIASSGRLVLVGLSSDKSREVDFDRFVNTNVNAVLFVNKDDGVRLSKMVRLLVDSDEDLMNKQVIEML